MKVAQALEKVVEDLLGDHILTPVKQLRMLNKLSYSEAVKYQQERTIPAKFLE